MSSIISIQQAISNIKSINYTNTQFIDEINLLNNLTPIFTSTNVSSSINFDYTTLFNILNVINVPFKSQLTPI